MFDFGCHRLEVLTHCFGAVSQLTSMIANVLFAREVEDTAVAVLHFERGLCATVAVSHAAVEPRDTFEVFGSGGSLHVANLNAGELTIKSSTGSSRTEAHPPAPNLHQPLIDEFVDAVRHGREPQVPGSVGREIARLEEQIYSGRRQLFPQ